MPAWRILLKSRCRSCATSFDLSDAFFIATMRAEDVVPFRLDGICRWRLDARLFAPLPFHRHDVFHQLRHVSLSERQKTADGRHLFEGGLEIAVGDKDFLVRPVREFSRELSREFFHDREFGSVLLVLE